MGLRDRDAPPGPPGPLPGTPSPHSRTWGPPRSCRDPGNRPPTIPKPPPVTETPRTATDPTPSSPPSCSAAPLPPSPTLLPPRYPTHFRPHPLSSASPPNSLWARPLRTSHAPFSTWQRAPTPPLLCSHWLAGRGGGRGLEGGGHAPRLATPPRQSRCRRHGGAAGSGPAAAAAAAPGSFGGVAAPCGLPRAARAW